MSDPHWLKCIVFVLLPSCIYQVKWFHLRDFTEPPKYCYNLMPACLAHPVEIRFSFLPRSTLLQEDREEKGRRKKGRQSWKEGRWMGWKETDRKTLLSSGRCQCHSLFPQNTGVVEFIWSWIFQVFNSSRKENVSFLKLFRKKNIMYQLTCW